MPKRELATIIADLEKHQLVRTKQTQAACANEAINPDIFFEPSREAETIAKAICHACPLKVRCFDYALTNNEQGVWGETTEKERALIRTINKRRKH